MQKNGRCLRKKSVNHLDLIITHRKEAKSLLKQFMDFLFFYILDFLNEKVFFLTDSISCIVTTVSLTIKATACAHRTEVFYSHIVG